MLRISMLAIDLGNQADSSFSFSIWVPLWATPYKYHKGNAPRFRPEFGNVQVCGGKIRPEGLHFGRDFWSCQHSSNMFNWGDFTTRTCHWGKNTRIKCFLKGRVSFFNWLFPSIHRFIFHYSKLYHSIHPFTPLVIKERSTDRPVQFFV